MKTQVANRTMLYNSLNNSSIINSQQPMMNNAPENLSNIHPKNYAEYYYYSTNPPIYNPSVMYQPHFYELNNCPHIPIPSYISNDSCYISSSDIKPIRKKAFSRRSKTGCLTCRSRRIKCDELKPICTHCKKSNKECVYAASTTTSTNKTKRLSKSTRKLPKKASVTVNHPISPLLPAASNSPTISNKSIDFFSRDENSSTPASTVSRSEQSNQEVLKINNTLLPQQKDILYYYTQIYDQQPKSFRNNHSFNYTATKYTPNSQQFGSLNRNCFPMYPNTATHFNTMGKHFAEWLPAMTFHTPQYYPNCNTKEGIFCTDEVLPSNMSFFDENSELNSHSHKSPHHGRAQM
mgnify:CR=1 FL=1